MRSFSKLSLGGVTALTMAISTFPFTVFSVLASDLIEEFEITRAQLGILATATGLVGALTAPYWGRVTDRIGSHRATVAVLIVGAVTLLGVSAAPTYALLIVASLTTGVPNGWSNPATNSLIVDTVAVGARGVITGVKQSGVQVGTFLGGALLPLLAVTWGWRWATAVFVLVPVAGLAGMIGRRPPNHHERAGDWTQGRLPRSVWWIAFYGTVSGLATSAMFVFMPLFAEEDQLWTPQAAGALIAATGAFGIAARILWPSLSERRLGHGRTLRVLAVLSTMAAVLLALAALGLVGSWALVPAALLFAAGSISWNAVGMLAVMEFSPKSIVGKGTGIVLLGFLLGYAFGSPMMGYSVDALGSYAPGWIGAAALLLSTAVIAGRIPQGGTLKTS
jgi:predicted MFS family arabinose efflux permease